MRELWAKILGRRTMHDLESTLPAGALDVERLKQQQERNKNLYGQYAMQAAAQVARKLLKKAR